MIAKSDLYKTLFTFVVLTFSNVTQASAHPSDFFNPDNCSLIVIANLATGSSITLDFKGKNTQPAGTANMSIDGETSSSDSYQINIGGSHLGVTAPFGGEQSNLGLHLQDFNPAQAHINTPTGNSPKTVFVGGDGTQDDPYIFEGSDGSSLEFFWYDCDKDQNYISRVEIEQSEL